MTACCKPMDRRATGLATRVSRLGGAPGRLRALAVWTALTALTGCGDPKDGVTRLSPRGVPFLDGVPVPAGFQLVDRMTEDYESGAQRMARHVYEGAADPNAVRSFYREQMPLVGWNRVSDQNVKGSIAIRFEKQTEACHITIDRSGTLGRVRIQAVVMPFNRSPSEAPARRPMP